MMFISPKLVFSFLLLPTIILCVRVLTSCMSVYHVCACFRWSSEEGVRSSETEVKDGVSLHVGLEIEVWSSARAASVLYC